MSAVLAPSPPPADRSSQAWEACLELGYERRGARTVLVRNKHRGPLVVQKSLYPEGDAPCQNVIVHPPGGIAGGDCLQIDVSVDRGASVQLTTPGATKWYRSASAVASQRVRMAVAAGSVLEWLPQENVVFDGALAHASIRVDLARGARYLGWDVVCLGRTASGERFTRGAFSQDVELRSCDELVLAERAALRGGARLLQSRIGLRDLPVFGTFIAAGVRIDDDVLGHCRATTAQDGEGAVTRIGAVTLARYRGTSTASARQYFVGLWRVLRPATVGCAPRLPRLWNT